MGILKFFFGGSKNEVEGHKSMDEIVKIQEDMLAKMSPEVAQSSFNQACKLIPKGKFAEALVLFEAIKDHPETDAHTVMNCYNQIGACQYMLGNYEKAIENYIASIAHGFAADKADYNLWEAYETLYKEDKDKSYIERYLNQMPNGEYASKAKKIMA